MEDKGLPVSLEVLFSGYWIQWLDLSLVNGLDAYLILILFRLKLSFLCLVYYFQPYSVSLGTQTVFFIKQLQVRLILLIFPNTRLTTFIIITKNQIDTQNMERSIEIQTISKIVEHFQKLSYIQSQLLNSLSLSKEQDLSCYIGLINLLYNLALQYHKKGKQNVQHSPNENIYSDCSAGNILHLRGEILKEYGKFFRSLFHQPAFSFAKFDYQSFNSFCSARGLSDLIRSSRGLYPLINPSKKKPLHFLPNYRGCKGQSVLVGNKNWQTSTKVVKKYYNDQIKKNNVKQKEDKEEEKDKNKEEDKDQDKGKDIFNTSEYLKKNNQNNNANKFVNEDENLQKGIEMFYMLLTKSYEQFDQSIKLFQKQCVKDQKIPPKNKKTNQQVFERLKFWFQNYQSFVQNGFKFYVQSAQMPNFSLLENFIPQKFEDVIIQTIEKLFYQITDHNSNAFTAQTIADLRIKLNSLSEVVLDGSLIPQTSSYVMDYDQAVYYKESNRMLMLSYIHMIHKLLFPQDQENNLPKKIYMSIKSNQNPIQEPFNCVFYSDQELLNLYESGQLKELPTFFRYSPEISVKILKLLINKNPSNLFDYMDNITILQPYQRLQVLINSKFIGDVSKININANNSYIIDDSEYQTEGQRLLSILAANTNQYKKIIRNQNQKVDVYQTFINQWRQFYNFYRNFYENYLSQFLLKFKASLASKSQVGIEGQRNYLIPSDFILPHQRNDSYYHIIDKFVLIFEQDVEKFTKMLEEMSPDTRKNDMIFKNAVERLTRYVKIIMSSEFKQILHLANPIYSQNQNQLQMETQEKEQKSLFQDRVWKIYAEAYLLLNEFSKKLVMNSGVQQRKNPMITNKHPGPGQKVGMFGGRQNHGNHATEIIDVDDDDDNDDDF